MPSVSRRSLLAACLVALASAEDVCNFSLERLYVPASNHTQFPEGYLPCLDATNATLSRCNECTCREMLTVKHGGSEVSWGICVELESTTKCAAPQKLCTTEERSMTESTDPQAAATSAPLISKPMTQTVAPSAYRPETVEADDTKTDAVNKSSSSPTLAIVVGSVAVVGVVGGLMLYRARRSKPKASVTPTHPDFFVFDSPSKPCASPSTIAMTPPPISSQRDTLDTDEFVLMGSYDDPQVEFDSQRSLYSAAFRKFVITSPGSDLYADTTRSMNVDDDFHMRERDSCDNTDLVLTSDSAFSDLYYANGSRMNRDLESSASSITFYEETTRSPREEKL